MLLEIAQSKSMCMQSKYCQISQMALVSGARTYDKFMFCMNKQAVCSERL